MADNLYKPANKTHQVQVYYNNTTQDESGVQQLHRVWLNRENKGLWAAVRDSKLNENITGQEQVINVEVIFTMNHSKAIIANWDRPLFIKFKDNTYRVVAKPDEYNYMYGDIKVYAVKATDDKKADSEEWLS
ncbi:MAG: head-tail adaptor protein [Firmicutes bacterium]|nr:head-tail adaptor protein [Bacillota bacterium]